MRRDDVMMEETGRRWRIEQWEEIREVKLRSEAMRMAERLGEEMWSELSKGMNRDARRVGEVGGRK